jgi:NAD(P)-dependent dehydrogenase (short-subunit alcohol dehydrogenase family)
VGCHASMLGLCDLSEPGPVRQPPQAVTSASAPTCSVVATALAFIGRRCMGMNTRAASSLPAGTTLTDGRPAQLDVLVNNAGIDGPWRHMHAIDADDAQLRLTLRELALIHLGKACSRWRQKCVSQQL